ncbi:MAG TPA: cyclase [Acidimicrobiia bacterium]|nr:cyclase [Acidimicrobiia bacterium]
MGQALIIVNHEVNDYATWRAGYEDVQPLRDRHGVTAANVLQDPADPNNVTVLHWFPSVAQAQAFVGAPELRDAMQKAGVAGPPRIEITVEA